MNADELLKLENQLCFPMYACSREITKAYHPLLQELDLTYTQYIVMMVLWEEKTMSVKDICSKLYLDSGTLTPLLKKLESKSLVTRQRDPEDERSVLITLTPAGQALREQAKNVPIAMAAKVEMTQEEYQTMHRLLYRIISTLRAGSEAE